MFGYGLLVGLFLGVNLGVLIMALMSISAARQRDEEKYLNRNKFEEKGL